MKRKRKSKLAKAKDNVRSRYWLKKADAAWSAAVRASVDGCALCGERPTEAHHLINRSVKHTRHCVENGIPLCAAHHKWSNRLSAHGAPLAFAYWLLTNRSWQWDWVQAYKHDILGEIDYRAAYERLTGAK